MLIEFGAKFRNKGEVWHPLYSARPVDVMSKVPIQAGRFSRRPPGTRRPGTVSVARPSAICRYYNGNVGDATEVGKYPKGASPYGVLNMAGNVWEWVNDMC